MAQAGCERITSRFRWVDLQLQELANCFSPQQVEDQLCALPRSLEEAYGKSLLRSRKPEDLKIFLQWMAFSNRPLSLEELACTVVVDSSAAGVPIYNAKNRYMDIRDVLSVCSGFVVEFKDD